jgi:hypothetical protein
MAKNRLKYLNGSITLAFCMSSLDVRFTVECVFTKIPLKTHKTVKRTSKLHIQNASVFDL